MLNWNYLQSEIHCFDTGALEIAISTSQFLLNGAEGGPQRAPAWGGPGQDNLVLTEGAHMPMTNAPKLFQQQHSDSNGSIAGQSPPFSETETAHPFDAIDGSQSNLLASIHAGILTIQQTANLLSCSVDTLRRIPMDELPTYVGPGRGVIYMLDDIKGYLVSRKRPEKRGSGLGRNANRPRPQPPSEGRNQAEIALRNLGKAGSR